MIVYLRHNFGFLKNIMKKTLILCICFIWLPLNTEALNLKYENKGNYYVSINNAVYKLNKIMDLNTNEYLFNIFNLSLMK